MAYTQEQINAALATELAANPNLSQAALISAGKSLGLSDAQLIENPLSRLDELDTLELRFAQSTIPVTTLNEQFVEDPERAADDLQSGSRGPFPAPVHLLGFAFKTVCCRQYPAPGNERTTTKMLQAAAACLVAQNSDIGPLGKGGAVAVDDPV